MSAGSDSVAGVLNTMERILSSSSLSFLLTGAAVAAVVHSFWLWILIIVPLANYVTKLEQIHAAIAKARSPQ